MFLRNGASYSNGVPAVLEREQLTLSNVQIDSWLMQFEAGAFEATLRTILAKYVWRRAESIELARSACGRLFLREDVLGRPLYLAFGCSPTFCAVIVSREPRMGVEIVNPPETDELMPKIEDAVCAQERDLVAGLSPAARRRALLSIWTRKRALQQANALIDVTPPQAIVVGLGELPLELPASFGWNDRWRLHAFTLRSGELGTIAVYHHEQLLVLGAGDRRTGAKKGTFTAYERRR